MLEQQVGFVQDLPARIERPPGQVRLLVREEELRGPRTGFGKHLHGEGVAAAEERRDRAAAHRVGGAQPGDMAALRLAVLVGDAEADDAELRVGGVHLLDLAQHTVVDKESVVVQLDDDVHVTEFRESADGDVTAAGAAEVLVELDRGHTAGEVGQAGDGGEVRQRGAVAHDDQAGGQDVLYGDRGQQGFDLLRAVAHGHDGYADARFGQGQHSWARCGARDGSRSLFRFRMPPCHGRLTGVR